MELNFINSHQILQKLIFDHGKYSLFTENKPYTLLAWEEI